MTTEIAMPKLGMTMSEGKVVEWPVPIGDHIDKGQLALIIESEKAEVEIESTGTGFLRHIYVDVEDTVPCGTLLAVLTETADEAFGADEYLASYRNPEAEIAAASARTPRAPVTAPRTAKAGGERKAITPAARKRGKELGLDVSQVAGTGPGGRVTKEDVDAYALQRQSLREVADGVSLEAPSVGDGETVVLLPGFGTDVSVFAPQIPALSERYEVIGINPRGVGQSDAPDTDRYDVGTSADDAAALIDESAHVIGTSLGSATAIELALRHPDKVRSLTLIAPLVTASPRLFAVLDAWCRLARNADPESVADALLPWMFSPAYLADENKLARTRAGLVATLSRVRADTLDRTLNGLRHWSGTREPDLEKIETPTCVIGGGDDLLTPDAKAVANSISDARFVSVAGVGHALTIEAADAVSSELARQL
jgi:pimeloyl-ACP methyl ester carboxylesterase